VAGRGLEVAGQVLPFAVVGLLLAAVNARDLDLLALGDDVAAGSDCRSAGPGWSGWVRSVC
jgi:iron complex transport system permease protein